MTRGFSPCRAVSAALLVGVLGPASQALASSIVSAARDVLVIKGAIVGTKK